MDNNLQIAPQKSFTLPLSLSQRTSLKCGEIITLSGTVFTARDAAHKRIASILACNGQLPISLKDIAVYYCGPTPTLAGQIIGSCGPTTSARMDDYTPLVLGSGVTVMIGKGARSNTVNQAIKKHRAIYLAAIGGAGALYQSVVTKCDCVAFNDLGCEAIFKLEVKNMQLLVATDSNGNTVLR